MEKVILLSKILVIMWIINLKKKKVLIKLQLERDLYERHCWRVHVYSCTWKTMYVLPGSIVKHSSLIGMERFCSQCLEVGTMGMAFVLVQFVRFLQTVTVVYSSLLTCISSTFYRVLLQVLFLDIAAL